MSNPDRNEYPKGNVVPRVELSRAGMDSAMSIVRPDYSAAGVLFRAQGHSTSPMTSSALVCLRGGERFRDGQIGEDVSHMGKSVWRYASEGGLLVCRVLTRTSMLISIIQADVEPVYASAVATMTEGLEFGNKVLVSPQELRLFLDLPALMREDWKHPPRAGYTGNQTAISAIERDPRIFGFSEGVTEEVRVVLALLASDHPDYHLFD